MTLQTSCQERKQKIHDQCDGLVQEVNAKREFFLSDLEYEQTTQFESLESQNHDLCGQHSNIQSIILHTKDVLAETVPEVFLQLAKSVSERYNPYVVQYFILLIQSCENLSEKGCLVF